MWLTVSCPTRSVLLLSAHDDERGPILVIEDLGSAHWPPPWRDEHVAAALASIDRLHKTRTILPSYRSVHGHKELGWQTVARNPDPFFALEVAPVSWLAAALPALLDAEAACSTKGSATTHWDLRSDNMCFTAHGEGKLVDWAEACLSNPALDLGFWLPSLHSEGGPPPEAVLADSPEIAAWVSGFFAARAGLPAVPDAPRVRHVQRQQLSTALKWAQRALKLPVA